MTVKVIEDAAKTAERIKWALDSGYVVPGNSEGMYRVVETQYIGTPMDIGAYLAGLAHGKAIERGTYPLWKNGDDEPVYETEQHPER